MELLQLWIIIGTAIYALLIYADYKNVRPFRVHYHVPLEFNHIFLGWVLTITLWPVALIISFIISQRAKP